MGPPQVDPLKETPKGYALKWTPKGPQWDPLKGTRSRGPLQVDPLQGTLTYGPPQRDPLKRMP